MQLELDARVHAKRIKMHIAQGEGAVHMCLKERGALYTVTQRK
jgi:hypothetical protein